MTVLPEGLPKSTPLSEVPAETIDELFARDPLKLSTQDISVLVNYFRSQRHKWAQLEAEGKTRKKRESAPVNIASLLEDL